MKILCSVALLLTAIQLSAGANAQTDDPAVLQKLKFEYMRAEAAIRNHDLDRAINHHMKGFTLKVSGKTLNLKDVTEATHWEIVSAGKITELKFSIESLTVKGDTAVATVKQNQTMQVFKNMQPYDMADTQVSVDTWIKTQDGWRLKSQEITKSSSTVNGKPVPLISGM